MNNCVVCREFNTILIDPKNNTIKKSSRNIQKIEDEYSWFVNIPKEFRYLCPNIVSFKKNSNNATLEMELFDHTTLSKLFIFDDLTIKYWNKILHSLFEINKLFKKNKGKISKNNFKYIYFEKTWERVTELMNQNVYWEKLWNYSSIVINSKRYKNIKEMKNKLNYEIKKIIDNSKITLIHGDYHLSNILFDSDNFVFKLVDPRGRLREQTIYGDARYDIAKLRHSVVGGYDFIINDFFELSEKENFFEISRRCNSYQEEINGLFDNMVVEFGFNLKEIKLIEALLFVSMIPLHKENFERQKYFYLTAVIKLNNCF